MLVPHRTTPWRSGCAAACSADLLRQAGSDQPVGLTGRSRVRRGKAARRVGCSAPCPRNVARRSGVRMRKEPPRRSVARAPDAAAVRDWLVSPGWQQHRRPPCRGATRAKESLHAGSAGRPRPRERIAHGLAGRPRRRGEIAHGLAGRPRRRGEIAHGLAGRPRRRGEIAHGLGRSAAPRGEIAHGLGRSVAQP